FLTGGGVLPCVLELAIDEGSGDGEVDRFALAVSHHLDVLPEGVELLLELQGEEPLALEHESLRVREGREADPERGVVRQDRLVLEDAPQVDRALSDLAVELNVLFDVEVRAD